MLSPTHTAPWLLEGTWFLNPEAKIQEFNVKKQTIQTDIINKQRLTVLAVAKTGP